MRVLENERKSRHARVRFAYEQMRECTE
jgi:hypothetical protein